MSRPWRERRITPESPDNAPSKFTEFAGLVNTRSRKEIGLHALHGADNVLISDTKRVVRRSGYQLVRAGNIQSAYGFDGTLFVVDDGTMLRVGPPDRTVVAGLTGTDYSWAVTNRELYFVNGVEAGLIRDGVYLPWRIEEPIVTSVTAVDNGVLPQTAFNVGATYTDATWRFCATYEAADGREGPPSDFFSIVASPQARLFRIEVAASAGYRTNIYVTEPDGTVFRLAASTTSNVVTISPTRVTRELMTYGLDGLPTDVYMIEFFQSRCYAAEYIPALDLSIIWISKPYAFHIFSQQSDFIIVPGKVGLMRWCNREQGGTEGMIIGTTRKIYRYAEDDKLYELANYGVVPGQAGDSDPLRVTYFWTQRGICRAMPFENLTEVDLSMAPGKRVASKVVYMNGAQYFLSVTLGGGIPFNKRTERTT